MTMEEARETFVPGLTVTRDGRFYHNGRSVKVYKRQTYGKHGGKHAFLHITKNKVVKNFSAGKLMASAWMDGFDAERDRVGYRDGDAFNVSLDNLIRIVPGDFSRITDVARMNNVKKAKRERARKELEALGLEWGRCSFPGLECTREGVFRYNGYPINSYVRVMKRANGKESKHRFLIINEGGGKDGKKIRLTASKMVASAWKFYNPETDFVIYKDGDPANIHVDNLQVVGEKVYVQYVQRNCNKEVTDRERWDRYKKTCEAVCHDSAMTLRYMNTGDLTEINGYLKKEIIPRFNDWLTYTKRFKTATVRYLLTSVIEMLYLKLDNGAPICNYYSFCTKTVVKWAKSKRFDPWMFETPEKPYSKVVTMRNEEINIDGLKEKFNVVRKKKKK